MLALLNGQERTVGEWVKLTEITGWKIKRVYQIDPFGQAASLIEATLV